MKKFMALILTLTTICGLVACGGNSKEELKANTDNPATAAEEKTYTIKLPNIYGETHFENAIYKEYFIPQLEERSNGTLKVELYPNSTLATDEEIYAGIRSGVYKMGITSVIFQDLLPQVGALQLPFLFEDFAHAKEYVFDKGYGVKLAEGSEEIGFKVLTCVSNGFRVMTLNKKIESMNDFKGFKMRTANYQNMVDCFTHLGCVVTPMAMSEIFTALEQKVVDGQENPPATIYSSGWYEIQDYMLLSNHVFTPDFLMVNCDFWNNLSDSQRTVLQEVANETAELIWARAEESYFEDVETMKTESGIEVYSPSAEFRQAMVEATSPMYDTFYAAHPEYKDMYEEMRNHS